MALPVVQISVKEDMRGLQRSGKLQKGYLSGHLFSGVKEEKKLQMALGSAAPVMYLILRYWLQKQNKQEKRLPCMPVKGMPQILTTALALDPDLLIHCTHATKKQTP